MESVQTDVNPAMRAILVDWLVEVAQEYRLTSDTLFLSVAYIDRFLSLADVRRNKLQLVRTASFLL
jgi:cyclin-A